MTKIVCDLCGKNINASILFRSINTFHTTLVQCGCTLDLCDDCRAALDKWVSERKRESEDKK